MAKLKSILAEKAANAQREFIEAFIDVIEREDKDFAKELKIPLSVDEISLLKKIEVEVNGISEDQAEINAQRRADQSAMLAQANSERLRKKSIVPETQLETQSSTDSNILSERTRKLVNEVLDSQGDEQIKADLAETILGSQEQIKAKNIQKQQEEAITTIIKDPNKVTEVISGMDFTLNEGRQNPISDDELSSTSHHDQALAYLASQQKLGIEVINKESERQKQQSDPIITSAYNFMLINSLMTQFENRIAMTTIGNRIAIAAGEEEVRNPNKRVWVSGLYGVGKQGSSLNKFGYRTNICGITIGADINLGENENNLIGVAYSNARLSLIAVKLRIIRLILTAIYFRFIHKLKLSVNYCFKALFHL